MASFPWSPDKENAFECQKRACVVAGTYVRFQPRSADFQPALGEVMEHALQASMFTHSTLTEGEWVQIAHDGTMHDVKVLTLQPEAAVSIIGQMFSSPPRTFCDTCTMRAHVWQQWWYLCCTYMAVQMIKPALWFWKLSPS